MAGGVAKVQLVNGKVLLTGESIRVTEFEVPDHG